MKFLEPVHQKSTMVNIRTTLRMFVSTEIVDSIEITLGLEVEVTHRTMAKTIVDYRINQETVRGLRVRQDSKRIGHLCTLTVDDGILTSETRELLGIWFA